LDSGGARRQSPRQRKSRTERSPTLTFQELSAGAKEAVATVVSGARLLANGDRWGRKIAKKNIALDARYR
jgi:hypothetical protein